MPEPTDVVRGTCARCGGPIAKRRTAPGPVEARCNLCQATTTLGEPPPTLPLAAPVSTKHLVLAAALIVAIAVGAAVAALLITQPAPAWTRLEQELVPEFTATGTVFTVVSRAYDDEGELVDGAELPRWHFAHAPTRVSAKDVTWTSCAPSDCRFEAPLGTFAYIDQMGTPGRFQALVFDTSERKLYRWSALGDHFSPIDDWQAHFKSFRQGKLSLTAAQPNDDVWLTVSAGDKRASGDVWTLAALQGGVELDNATVRAGRSGSISDFLDPGSFTLLASDPGGELATRTYQTGECTSRLTIEVIRGSDGAISLGDAKCL